MAQSSYPQNLHVHRKSDFVHVKDSAYLDHAGSTLYTKSQIDEYTSDLQSNLYGNPHSGNPSSNLMSDVIHQVRCTVLSHFNVTPDEYDIVFTSGSTGALHKLARCFDWTRGLSNFAYLEDNHTSVVGMREVAAEYGATATSMQNSKECNGTKNEAVFSLKSYKPIIVKHSKHADMKNSNEVYNLFAYPAQSNFSGCKYPLSWIEEVQRNGVTQCTKLRDLPGMTTKEENEPKWSVLLDAASFAATSQLNLRRYSPDFVCISFYKIFGFPTGLGALLVRKDSVKLLSKKVYFGGGTADGYLASQDYYKARSTLHDRLEDGSLPFLDILALKHGFDTMYKITGNSMLNVKQHTFSLIQKLYKAMANLQYNNGSDMVKVYSHTKYSESDTQGAIITFNVKRPDESFVGFNHVLHLAAARNIHLRGGCFCNVGACSSMLRIDPNVLKHSYESGHSCGDHIDLVKGRPIGAIRASLGYMSTLDDVDALLLFLRDCFLLADRPDEEVYYDALSYIPLTAKPQMYLKEIFVYPVKSCRAMKVSEWPICETGLKYDRSWMVVNEHGVCMTLKRMHKLTLIQPFINLMNSTLMLQADGFGSVTIPLHENDKSSITCSQLGCQTKVCGDRILGHDCGDEARNWLTNVLGQKATLLRKSPEVQRFSKIKRTLEDGSLLSNKSPRLALTNEAQYLMVSQSTVEYLRQVMLELNVNQDVLHVEDQKGPTQEAPLDVNTIIGRFRCNYLLAGGKPFTEESWTDVFIETTQPKGDFIHLHCTGLCNRCSMVCVDQITGKRSIEPLRTLGTLPPSKYICDKNQNKLAQRRNHFGVYLYSNVTSATIKVGSKVTVRRK